MPSFKRHVILLAVAVSVWSAVALATAVEQILEPLASSTTFRVIASGFHGRLRTPIMLEVSYRLMKPDDAIQVSTLISSTFDEFIAPEYTPQGVEEFRKYAGPIALLERANRDHFIVVATTTDALVGMIEMRQNNHVALLFVAKGFQRRGVARALFEHVLVEARTRDTDLERVTVNSSRYGVSAYESLGFRQTGPDRAVNGILFIPMAIRLEGKVEPRLGSSQETREDS